MSTCGHVPPVKHCDFIKLNDNPNKLLYSLREEAYLNVRILVEEGRHQPILSAGHMADV